MKRRINITFHMVSLKESHPFSLIDLQNSKKKWYVYILPWWAHYSWNISNVLFNLFTYFKLRQSNQIINNLFSLYGSGYAYNFSLKSSLEMPHIALPAFILITFNCIDLVLPATIIVNVFQPAWFIAIANSRRQQMSVPRRSIACNDRIIHAKAKAWRAADPELSIRHVNAHSSGVTEENRTP